MRSLHPRRSGARDPATALASPTGRAAGRAVTAFQRESGPAEHHSGGDLCRLGGVAVPLAPVRHQLFITEPVPGIDRADPIVRVVDAAVYLRPARGGLFTMSPDGRFVAGPVPALPGLCVASGCNGSGFSSSPALGEMLATWITTGTPPPGAEALSPARFGLLPDDALITHGLWQYAHYYDPAPAPAAGAPAPSSGQW